MSSIIAGYNYDIFISYRQKDNKGDRWVSEFADSLKTELESTFKEEISVYFDINPHDGLLETHEVDDSLKEKLKCLVFIPVISRTYCDPRSFAWEHEFKAFVEQASKDQFGLKVRLPNGNVASRVLPVRIHDLDNEDVKLFEGITGGVMRTLDFVFKTSSGVNRPLKSREDHPNDNLNKTYYQDQINKVSLALKEIINGISHHEQKAEEVSKEVINPVSIPQKHKKTKVLTGSAIILALIILGFLLIPKLFKPSEQLEKSVAVLPFTNLSDDPEQDYFSDGMVDAILDHLFKIGDLQVIARTSSMKYKNTKLTLKEIAHELHVSALLEGSVQKTGNKVRITTQLIDPRTGFHLWSETYDRDLSDVFSIQTEIAQNVAKELKATLTAEEKIQISKNQTSNLEAYNFYLQGRFFINKRTETGFKKSVEYFEKAVAADSDYALAYAGLADAYFLLAWYGEIPKQEAYARSKGYANRALSIDKNLAEAHTVLGGILTWKDWNWEEAQSELKLGVKLNPNFVNAHSYYSELLDVLGENDEARKEIDLALSIDPFFATMHTLSAIYYYHECKFRQSLEEWEKVKELNPDNNNIYWFTFYCCARSGEDLRAIDALQEALLREDSIKKKDAPLVKSVYAKSGIKGVWEWLIELELKEPNPDALFLAKLHAIVGKNEVSLNWLEKAFENPSSDFPRINNSPDWDNVRLEPRFQAIIKKMGLTEYQKRK
jgi:TolB-like protein